MPNKFLTPMMVGAIVGTALTGPLYAQDQVCSKGDDVRTLSVLTPGIVGKACDLRYTYDNGGTVKTPYHANNSAGFCSEKANTLVADLTASGFACTASVGTQTIVDATPVAAPVAGPETGPVAAVETSAPIANTRIVNASVPSVSVASTSGANVDDAKTPTPAAPVSGAVEAPTPVSAPAQATQVAGQPVIAALESASEDRLEVPTHADAAQPNGPVETAALPAPEDPGTAHATPSTGPVTLTTASAIKTVAARAPRQSAVGKLMGAEPEEDIVLNTEPVQVAAAPSVPEAANDQPAPVFRDTPLQDEPTAEKTKVQKLRPAPDIIRGVLAAQAAAWNEGDLDAFMAGYWKSPDLRFVSGTEITGGWSQTLKRYKSRYGTGSELGQLSFEKLDVEMVTDDVAIVVGRFLLERDPALDTGVFTLVVKRFNGRWRIVHDHTVNEQTAAAE